MSVERGKRAGEKEGEGEMTATKLGPPGMERVEKEEEEEGERLLTFTGSQATPPLRGGRREGSYTGGGGWRKRRGGSDLPPPPHISPPRILVSDRPTHSRMSAVAGNQGSGEVIARVPGKKEKL